MFVRIDGAAAQDLRARLLEDPSPDGIPMHVLRQWQALQGLGRLSFNSEALLLLGPFLARLIEAELEESERRPRSASGGSR